MAETLTYDAGTDTVTDGEGNNLTPAEQESLKVGEELTSQQDQLLAGKYEDAQQLEKAYIELQKKLGENGQEEKTGEPEAETEVDAEKADTEETEKDTELSPAAELITSASDEYYSNDGKLSPETVEKFSSMSSKELVEAYLQVQSNLPQGGLEDSGDISDSTVNEVKNFAGGEQSYQDMVNWASDNLDSKSIQAFDSIINTGSVDAIKLAVSGLKSQYQNAVGYEGTMLSGKAPKTNKDVYRSQQELVAAMSDRRYDKDPAYRQDVIERLSRSDNLEF
tara:strand:+ start:2173 stop:3009 length:837 start_codon:yes stop_codon:yes gene_type:complete